MIIRRIVRGRKEGHLGGARGPMLTQMPVNGRFRKIMTRRGGREDLKIKILRTTSMATSTPRSSPTRKNFSEAGAKGAGASKRRINIFLY